MAVVAYPFDDLSGAELRRRLEQRGTAPEVVDELMEHRDNCEVCRKIVARILKEA